MALLLFLWNLCKNAAKEFNIQFKLKTRILIQKQKWEYSFKTIVAGTLALEFMQKSWKRILLQRGMWNLPTKELLRDLHRIHDEFGLQNKILLELISSKQSLLSIDIIVYQKQNKNGNQHVIDYHCL